MRTKGDRGRKTLNKNLFSSTFAVQATSERPCQGGLPGRLSEFQTVPCRHFLIVLSEVRVAVGYVFNSTAVCRYFIWVLSLLFGPCRLSEFTLAGPHQSNMEELSLQRMLGNVTELACSRVVSTRVRDHERSLFSILRSPKITTVRKIDKGVNLGINWTTEIISWLRANHGLILRGEGEGYLLLEVWKEIMNFLVEDHIFDKDYYWKFTV